MYKDDEENKDKMNIKLQCYISDVYISNSDNILNAPLGKDGLPAPAGFIFKFEPKLSGKSLGSRKHRPCTFQFRYNLNKHNITGEFTDSLVDELLSDGDYLPTNVENSNYISNLPFFNDDNKLNKSDQQEEKRINYAEGIRTMILRDGKPMEANLEDDEEQEKDELNDPNKPNGSSNKNNLDIDNGDDFFSATMFDSTFKTRKQLSDILGNNKTPKTILRLNILGHILLIFVLALTFSDFFVSNSQFNKIKDNVNLINLSYRRISEVQNIVAKTRDLLLIQVGIMPYQDISLTTEKANGFPISLGYITKNISDSTNLIQDIQRELQIKSKDLIINEKNKKLTTSNAIEMFALIGESKSYDINEATRQVVTMAINLKDQITKNPDLQTTSFFNVDDANWFFITKNCFNNYLQGLLDSSAGFVDDLTTRTDSMNQIFLLIFLIAVIAIFLGVLCLVPSMLSVNSQKQEVLGLFLYLNEEGIKGVYNKSEKLISNLQVGEDENDMSEPDDTSMEKIENKGDEIVADGLGKRKKNFKTNWKTNKCFLFLIIGFGSVLEAYFIFNFYQNKSVLKDVKSLTKEINATSAAKSFFYLTANTQGMLFLNENMTVQNQVSSNLVKDNINNMFELDSTIHEEHSINVGIHSEDYKEIYNNMMMLKPCTIMGSLTQNYNTFVGTDACALFASGTLGQGMALGLARHYENMRNMYSKYLQIIPNTANTDTTYVGTLDCFGTVYARSKTANSGPFTNLMLKRMCLMAASEAKEIGSPT